MNLLFQELGETLGYDDSINFQKWVHWRGDLGQAFRDALNATEDFTGNSQHQLVHELRKEVESLFLELLGKAPEESWFESMIAQEEPASDEEMKKYYEEGERE